jgi:tRNA A-37 threonylcarbamoyl transferase component Bud32
MAEVYKAYHPGLDCYVAIKVLHSFLAKEEDFLTRFQREAKVIATFRHPNIIQVYDFDYDAEHSASYMVMEFIDGLSLKTRLQEMAQEGKMLPLDEALRIVIAVANALDYAHRHGMVHRDIKPANIMFTQDGQIILTDFGIARMINTSTLTASGAMVGTPAYMAPEQGSRAGDERSDIYSLGVVLYQLVTGALPFESDTPLGIILKHINAPLTPPTKLDPDLPSGVEAVIIHALAKDPDNRYQTAWEFAADLERCLAGKPVEPISPEVAMAPLAPEAMAAAHGGGQVKRLARAGLPGPSPTPLPGARSKRGWIAALAAMLVLILLGSAVLLTTETPGGLFAALFSQKATPTPGAIGTVTSTVTPDLTATYNVNATQFAVWMATYVATTGVTPTPSPNPTSTPDLTATALAACVFDMEVVQDRPVWPRVLMPRQQFIKHWTIKNVGTCTWPEGVQLRHASGDELQVVREPEIDPLPPGGTAEVEIALRAPAAYDRYTGVWELQDGAGNPIGEKLEVTCRVGPTPMPRPTATPTATLTPEFTLTPAESFHFSDPIVVRWHDIPGGKWWAEVGLTAWGGDGNYRYYLNTISEKTEFFNGTFEIECRQCRSWWGTVIVTSAGQVERWKGEIPYPDPSRCEEPPR